MKQPEINDVDRRRFKACWDYAEYYGKMPTIQEIKDRTGLNDKQIDQLSKEYKLKIGK